MRSLLLASGIAAPLLCSNALMSERTLPTFQEVMHQPERRTLSLPALALGLTLIVTTLIATENALAFVFDPRWRDFQFAGLIMVAVPFATLTLLRRPASGPRPIAEPVFASLFAATTIYATFNEGFSNWQAIWTSAAYFLLIATLSQVRSVAAAKTVSPRPIVFSGVGPLDGKAAAREPAAVTVNPEPALQAGALVRIRGNGPRAGSDFGS
jgi:glucan 1,3-beta-glucosidase